MFALFSEADVSMMVQLVASYDGCQEELRYLYTEDSLLQIAYNGSQLIVNQLTDDGKKYREVIQLQAEEIEELKVMYEKMLRKERRRKKILGITTYSLAGFAAVMTLLYIAK